MDYCDCHAKHVDKFKTMDKHTDQSHEDHKLMWEAIKKKVGVAWLYALVPVFLVWLGFQMTVYNTVKNIDKKVAVIETKLEEHMKSTK